MKFHAFNFQFCLASIIIPILEMRNLSFLLLERLTMIYPMTWLRRSGLVFRLPSPGLLHLNTWTCSSSGFICFCIENRPPRHLKNKLNSLHSFDCPGLAFLETDQIILHKNDLRQIHVAVTSLVLSSNFIQCPEILYTQRQ